MCIWKDIYGDTPAAKAQREREEAAAFDEEFEIMRKQGTARLMADLEQDAAKLAIFDQLLAALQWCAEHPYAIGHGFKDVEPVKSALAAARAAIRS